MSADQTEGCVSPTRAEKFVTCACFVEGLRLSRWSDEEDVSLSMWVEKHYDGPVRWRQRVRHIWRIIRKGQPWEDEMSLTPEGVRDVVRFLLKADDGATVWWSSSPTGTFQPYYTTTWPAGGSTRSSDPSVS